MFRSVAVHVDDERQRAVLVAARHREQPFDLESVERLPRVRAPVRNVQLRAELGVERGELPAVHAVFEQHDLGRRKRRLEHRRHAPAVGAG